MRKILTFLLLALVLATAAASKKCDNKQKLDYFKPNKAELGQDWKQFCHDASQNAWNFDDNKPRPTEHLTPQGARLFYNGTVVSEELLLIDEGINLTLTACKQESLKWFTKPVWDAFYFNRVPEYKLIFVDTQYVVQEGESAGCQGMPTGAHGVFTAAGTVAGLLDRVNGSTPGSKGGIYIIVPKQSPEQLARPECKRLLRDGVRNEAEHVVFTNVPQLYFAFANDGLNGNHPYCAPANTSIIEWFFSKKNYSAAE